MKAVHNLHQAVPPLAPSHVVASDIALCDLSTFWRACKRGLAGLGPQLQAQQLGREHLDQLAPHMVGEQVWAMVEVRHFNTWVEFRAVIEDRWGFMPAQCHGAYYAMRPCLGKAFETFVTQVEDERAKLRILDEPVLRAF